MSNEMPVKWKKSEIVNLIADVMSSYIADKPKPKKTKFTDSEKWETLILEKIDSICMSYRHDFGLMPEHQKQALRVKAVAWVHAISWELPKIHDKEIT